MTPVRTFKIKMDQNNSRKTNPQDYTARETVEICPETHPSNECRDLSFRRLIFNGETVGFKEEQQNGPKEAWPLKSSKRGC
jgi:hypothetical protein